LLRLCYGSSYAEGLPLESKIGDNQKFKMKTDKNKAMVHTWSDSKSSETESYEGHKVSICLMTKEVQNKTECESSNKVDVSSLYEYFKKELIDTLTIFANLEQKLLVQI